MSTVKATRRARLSAMLGTKLGRPSLKVKKSAEKMLDAELDYINYLRGRKKLFFMTQIQQTRVQVGKKQFGEDDNIDYGKRGRFWRPRRNKKVKTKGLGKGNRIGRFFRNVRASGLKWGRKIKYSLPGRLVRGGARNVRNAGQFIGRQPGRLWRSVKRVGTKVKNKIGDGLNFVKRAGVNVMRSINTSIGNAFNWGKRHVGNAFNWGKRQGTNAVDFVRRKGGEGLSFAMKQINRIGNTPAAKSFKTWLSNPAVQKKLAKLSLKNGGRMIPIASTGLAVADMEHYANRGDWLKVILATIDAGASGTEAAYTTGVGAPIGGVASVIANAAGWSLTALELIDILRGKDPFARKVQNKHLEKLAEGAQVSSPTKALIGEGGESEFVIPQSKLGSSYQKLLEHVIGIITGAARGFLEKLPVSSITAQGLLGEITRIEAQLGITPKPISEFKGGKISKTLKGFGKKGSDIIYNTINRIEDVVSSVISQVAPNPQLDPVTVGTGGPSKEGSSNNEPPQVTQSMISGYPITDYYGSTAGRSRPHGGVDVGTPVGTPVSFAVPGQILAAGKYGDYGNLMDVWLPSAKIQMRIAHLVSFVKKSGKFEAGETLAKTGGAKGDAGSGSSTGPHLHFEVDTIRDSTRYGGSGNPLPYSGFIQLTGVQPGQGGNTGGPSLGASYGHPLSSTVKWPSSGGSMGGPSLDPNQKTGSSMSKQISFIPIPIKVLETVPVQVPVPFPVNKKTARSFGVDPLSGRYGEL